MSATDCIAGTPLKNLIWRRPVFKVKFYWREGTTPEDKDKFLRDLIASARDELNKL